MLNSWMLFIEAGEYLQQKVFRNSFYCAFSYADIFLPPRHVWKKRIRPRYSVNAKMHYVHVLAVA